MIRKSLDALYLWSGYLSAFFLVAIALTIVAQVLGRFAPKLIVVDSTETAGFCLAASTFFGLAYTYRQGAHIRVTLVTRLATGTLDRLIHLWSILVFAVVMGLMTYWSFDYVYFSYKFNDISPGLMAIPFWIPRSAMGLGSLILLIALIDEFVSVARGKVPSYVENDAPIFKSADGEASSQTEETR
ncbi:MAG: TRAP transporter small permease [Alphaproteobacteria bacterium]|nr:TRAP transporter small permease [Alphaproteobacteria bacterium]